MAGIFGVELINLPPLQQTQSIDSSTLLTFLQVIVLTFTALIYIGQAILRRGTSNERGFSAFRATQSARILGVGAVSLALSGIAVAVFLIFRVTPLQIQILYFWLAYIPPLDFWTFSPFVLLGFWSVITYLIFQRSSDSRSWWVLATVITAIWIYSAVGVGFEYYQWLPLFAAGTFALGISLFFVGIFHMSYLFLRQIEESSDSPQASENDSDGLSADREGNSFKWWRHR